MKHFNLPKQIVLLILAGGLLLLLLPFTQDYVISVSAGSVNLTRNTDAFAINYYQYCCNFIENLKYPYKFPYIEIAGIILVLALPISMMGQTILSVFHKYRFVRFLCFVSLLLMAQFGYYSWENVQYGYYVTVAHQLFVFLYFNAHRRSDRHL